jgi:hypothetical protein
MDYAKRRSSHFGLLNNPEKYTRRSSTTSNIDLGPLFRFSSKNFDQHPVVFYDDKHLYKDDIHKKLVKLPSLMNIHNKGTEDLNPRKKSLFKNNVELKSRYMDGVRPNYYRRFVESIEKFKNLEKDFQYLVINL